jgi:hypothetical protein
MLVLLSQLPAVASRAERRVGSWREGRTAQTPPVFDSFDCDHFVYATPHTYEWEMQYERT